MEIINCLAIEQQIKERLIKSFQAVTMKKLIIFQIGDNSGSNLYIKKKMQMAAELGVDCHVARFADAVTEAEMIEHITAANLDPTVGGYILQLPIPEHLVVNNLVAHFDATKDIDAFSAVNIGRLALNKYENKLEDCFIPPTAMACQYILNSLNVQLAGADVVVVGKSIIVGLPISLMMLN